MSAMPLRAIADIVGQDGGRYAHAWDWTDGNKTTITGPAYDTVFVRARGAHWDGANYWIVGDNSQAANEQSKIFRCTAGADGLSSSMTTVSSFTLSDEYVSIYRWGSVLYLGADTSIMRCSLTGTGLTTITNTSAVTGVWREGEIIYALKQNQKTLYRYTTSGTALSTMTLALANTPVGGSYDRHTKRILTTCPVGTAQCLGIAKIDGTVVSEDTTAPFTNQMPFIGPGGALGKVVNVSGGTTADIYLYSRTI